jgi:hypothetical protein
VAGPGGLLFVIVCFFLFCRFLERRVCASHAVFLPPVVRACCRCATRCRRGFLFRWASGLAGGLSFRLCATALNSNISCCARPASQVSSQCHSSRLCISILPNSVPPIRRSIAASQDIPRFFFCAGSAELFRLHSSLRPLSHSYRGGVQLKEQLVSNIPLSFGPNVEPTFV